MRSILEAYYEPQFSRPLARLPARSAGATPRLREIAPDVDRHERGSSRATSKDASTTSTTRSCWRSSREKIHDNRFLRLIENLLKAGYLEDWRYHATLSGTPQGGIVSPLLANIYLDRLDQFVEQTHSSPQYTRGDKRKHNPAYNQTAHQSGTAREARATRRSARRSARRCGSLPSIDTNDPGLPAAALRPLCRRLPAGLRRDTRRKPRDQAPTSATFLRDTLKLEPSRRRRR